jgi:glucans biosynthesis protein C
MKNAPTHRLFYLDNLKALLIIFVVLVHTAVTYSGIGSWFYKEPRPMGNTSYCLFFFFMFITQAYFMSLFFMISAYFVPGSLEKKGVKKFVADRLYRLGMPALIFAFLICPVCITIAHPNISLSDRYVQGIATLKIFSWTGPLWFVVALLIFTLSYLIIKRPLDLFISKHAFDVNAKNALTLVGLITFFAFVIRLIFPIGTSVMNMQLCFFSAYVFMFLVGIIAYQKDIFSKIDYRAGKRWLVAAFAVGMPLLTVILRFGVSSTRSWSFIGGWNAMSLLYAFLESYLCVTIIIALIGIFKERFNTQNTLQKFLSDNAFGVYVFHTPVLISISVVLKHVELPPLVKFAMVACLAVPASFMFSHVVRKIPVLRKIFS